MGSCTVCLRLKKCHLWLRTFLWWKVCIFLFSCISCTYLCRCAAFWPLCWAGQRTTSNLMVSKTWAFLSILHWMFPSPCDMPFWAFNLCYVSCCSNLMLEKSFLFFSNRNPNSTCYSTLLLEDGQPMPQALKNWRCVRSKSFTGSIQICFWNCLSFDIGEHFVSRMGRLPSRALITIQ